MQSEPNPYRGKSKSCTILLIKHVELLLKQNSLVIFLCLIVPPFSLFSQNVSAPKKTYLKIINVCETSLVAPWQAGIDATIQQDKLITDLRIGEISPYYYISFKEGD